MNAARRSIPQLHLPFPSPPDETALFQHDPSPNTRVRQEWEPGCQPDEVYDKALPAWRAWARRYLVKRLREEKEWMTDWQKRVRTERRDRYFYWTAVFGTHTFFMAFLPLFFWYGHPVKGRGMLNAVGLGIYISSFCKDLVCTPRPYSPPIVRLAMSTHAHEYGFPSSHSTNSFTIALFLSQWLWELRESVGYTFMAIANVILTVYVISVVGGRVYTGMHSIADIVGGSLMGIACWLIGILAEEPLELWTQTGSLAVPLVTVPITLACVHYHPAPVDPCPCFEDAIAILSVLLGGIIGQWWEVRYDLSPSALSRQIWGQGVALGVIIVVERLVIGIALLFGWRLAAKATLLRVLPTIFRFFSKALDFDLPTRRGYTAATSYQGYPSTPIRSMPSFINLPDEASSADATPTDSPVAFTAANGGSNGSLSPLDMPDSVAGLRRRGSAKMSGESLSVDDTVSEARKEKRKRRRPAEIKFDVEVLTKVGVYLGIGVLATTGMQYIYSGIEDRLFG